MLRRNSWVSVVSLCRERVQQGAGAEHSCPWCLLYSDTSRTSSKAVHFVPSNSGFGPWQFYTLLHIQTLNPPALVLTHILLICSPGELNAIALVSQRGHWADLAAPNSRASSQKDQGYDMDSEWEQETHSPGLFLERASGRQGPGSDSYVSNTRRPRRQWACEILGLANVCTRPKICLRCLWAGFTEHQVPWAPGSALILWGEFPSHLQGTMRDLD